jgi:hypothetical protein
MTMSADWALIKLNGSGCPELRFDQNSITHAGHLDSASAMMRLNHRMSRMTLRKSGRDEKSYHRRVSCPHIRHTLGGDLAAEGVDESELAAWRSAEGSNGSVHFATGPAVLLFSISAMIPSFQSRAGSLLELPRTAPPFWWTDAEDAHSPRCRILDRRLFPSMQRVACAARMYADSRIALHLRAPDG